MKNEFRTALVGLKCTEEFKEKVQRAKQIHEIETGKLCSTSQFVMEVLEKELSLEKYQKKIILK